MANTFIVTLSGTDYDSYADLDTANSYLAASITATDWTSATDATKGQALVTATRLLDRQAWLDAYDTFDLRKVVADIVNACCELAALFVSGDTSALTSATTEQTTKSLKAGSVSIEYFRQNPSQAARFPTLVEELLSAYLAGPTDAASVGTPYAGGTDVCSSFEYDYDVSRGI